MGISFQDQKEKSLIEEKTIVAGYSGVVSIPHDIQIDAAWYVDMFDKTNRCILWPGSRLINNPLKWWDDVWVHLSMQKVSKRHYRILTQSIDRALAELCAECPEIPIICTKNQMHSMTRTEIINFFLNDMKGRRG